MLSSDLLLSNSAWSFTHSVATPRFWQNLPSKAKVHRSMSWQPLVLTIQCCGRVLWLAIFHANILSVHIWIVAMIQMCTANPQEAFSIVGQPHWSSIHCRHLSKRTWTGDQAPATDKGLCVWPAGCMHAARP